MLIEGRVVDADAATSVFFFGTNTGLDTQLDALISLMNPAFSDL
jgi:hypothetical protein